MDTSETYKKSIVNPLTPMEDIEQVKWYEDPVYIKMCEKAEEIQALRSGIDIPFQRYFSWLGNDVFYTHPTMLGWKYVFLPRQDQLQEASGLDWRSFDRKCLVYEHPLLVPTKEQAGIRVVMKEKYNKVWVNNEWRNGSE